jgi:hypothetical protein
LELILALGRNVAEELRVLQRHGRPGSERRHIVGS